MHRFSRLLPVLCVFALAHAFAIAAPPESGPVRVAIVGLVHGHVAGFLPQLPKHPEVQLVGVSDPDASLRQKYAEKYHLDPKIFFPTEDAMIEALRSGHLRHAGLDVYAVDNAPFANIHRHVVDFDAHAEVP